MIFGFIAGSHEKCKRAYRGGRERQEKSRKTES